MDELNKWHSHPDYSEELAYMYSQQEEEQAGMQYYTPPPPMAPPTRSPSPFLEFLPHHHQHHSSSFPGFGVPVLPPRPLPPLGPVKNEPAGQPSSSSNRILSFGGQPPSTLNFSGGGGDWPEAVVEAVQQMPTERRSRTHWNTQEHVIAERKRREKMQQQFVALAAIVPDLTKTDKISLLGSTIEYVKQLEEKVKTLEGRRERRTSEATVFESKCRISPDNNDASCSTAGGFSPTVEASIHGDTVLLKICCLERRGVLVMIISELENQGLSIINTSVLPFTDSCLNITITAKIGAGFSSTVELITNLTSALRGFSS